MKNERFQLTARAREFYRDLEREAHSRGETFTITADMLKKVDPPKKSKPAKSEGGES